MLTEKERVLAAAHFSLWTIARDAEFFEDRKRSPEPILSSEWDTAWNQEWPRKAKLAWQTALDATEHATREAVRMGGISEDEAWLLAFEGAWYKAKGASLDRALSAAREEIVSALRR